jgi:heme exporter protein B
MSTLSSPQAALVLLRRDLTLAFRHRSEMFTPLFFFIIVTALFPMSIGAEETLLQQIAPGVIWVAALLAALLSLESMFRSDYQDGSLEQMLLTPQPLSMLVLGKVLAHWLRTGLPLVLIAPLVGFQYYLAQETLLTMMVALSLGTPVLSLLGAIGAALTLGVRGGGMLLSLLILPLYIPVLVYGAGAVAASASQSLSAQPFLLLLTAFLILAVVLTPVATAAALRISLG